MIAIKKLFRNLLVITGVFFILVVYLVFILNTTQLYSAFPENNRKLDLNSATEAVAKQFKDSPPSIKLVIYNNPMEKGAIIQPAFTPDRDISHKIRCNEESWLFVVDLHPGATFEHEIKIGIINKSNKDKPEIIDAHWWPIKILNDRREPLYLSSKRWEKVDREVKETLNPNCVTDSLSQEENIPPVMKIIGTPDASRKLWAIIICGYYEDGNDTTFSYDANDMYSTLRVYGVPENQIFYITPNKLQLENDCKVFCNDASVCSIKTCFEVIKGKILPKEKFLFFISTHGSDKKLTLENSSQEEETLTAQSLNDFLNKIHCKTQFIVINACRSGSFIDTLIKGASMANNRIVLTSSKSGEDSFKDLDNINKDPNIGDRSSEFLSGFIESFSKEKADKNKDDRISIQEAFYYAKKCAWCANNSATKKAHYKHEYHPQISYSRGISLCTEFLFWD